MLLHDNSSPAVQVLPAAIAALAAVHVPGAETIVSAAMSGRVDASLPVAPAEAALHVVADWPLTNTVAQVAPVAQVSTSCHVCAPMSQTTRLWPSGEHASVAVASVHGEPG